jgi:predicted ATPase with chaperone activity
MAHRFVTTRPFRGPHQTISDVGLIGGGQVPMPGELSLAHHSALCLDELPDCRRHGLAVVPQSLRSVLQEYNLPHVLNLHTLAEFARRVMAMRGSDRAR